jgi:hypothetical protein
MAYIITHNIKDINGNPIKKSTPASKIPQSVIAQFLSKDGKTPIKITPTYNPLNYLKA